MLGLPVIYLLLVKLVPRVGKPWELGKLLVEEEAGALCPLQEARIGRLTSTVEGQLMAGLLGCLGPWNSACIAPKVALAGDACPILD